MIINALINDETEKGASITPRYSTDLIALQSGLTLADQEWHWPRHDYDLNTPLLELPEIEERYMQFFHYCYGPGYGFLFNDWADYTSAPIGHPISVSDQILSPSVENPLHYPITKRYTIVSREYFRRIYKPIDGTVLVGTDQSYTIDYDLGIIQFTTIPSVVTCGFEFYVPVRFGNDDIEISINGNKADDIPVGRITGLTLREIIPDD